MICSVLFTSDHHISCELTHFLYTIDQWFVLIPLIHWQLENISVTIFPIVGTYTALQYRQPIYDSGDRQLSSICHKMMLMISSKWWDKPHINKWIKVSYFGRLSPIMQVFTKFQKQKFFITCSQWTHGIPFCRWPLLKDNGNLQNIERPEAFRCTL